MNNQSTPLGKFGFFVVPIAILLAFVLPSFWTAVVVGAAIGLVVANVRAVLLVGQMRAAQERNPLLGLQAKVQGIDASTQIRFIFFQSIIGAFVFAAFTAITSGIATFFR